MRRDIAGTDLAVVKFRTPIDKQLAPSILTSRLGIRWIKVPKMVRGMDVRIGLSVFGAILVASQANSTVLTRDFVLTSSSFSSFANEPAPFTALRATFRVTFDDTISGFQGAPVSFIAITDGMTNVGPFSAAPIVGYFPASGMSLFPRLGLGGAVNGGNVLGTNDFYFTFNASATGPTPAMLGFVTSDNVSFLASDAIVAPVSVTVSVAEPASWALMISGLGIVGGTLRRRSPVRVRSARC